MPSIALIPCLLPGSMAAASVKIQKNSERPLVHVSNLRHNGIVKQIDFHARALEFIRGQATTIRCQIGEAP